MVMVTRSCARKRACEIFDDTGSDNTCNVPPWCSSGKTYEKRKPRKIPESICEIRSAYLLPPNGWENSCKDKSAQSCYSRKRKNKSCRVQHRDNSGICGGFVFLTLFALAGLGAVVYFWSSQSKDREDIKALWLDKTSLAIDEECCYKMKQLAAALFQAEQSLRRTRRQHTLMLTAQTTKLAESKDVLENDIIQGATAIKGSNTKDWGGRAALWGIVPLWRSSPPPQTLLSSRRPTPADCWPFSGSRGEVIVELPRRMRVRRISVEHVRPDAARSAPRHFALYGLLENGTWIKGLNGEYRYKGPAKQFFTILREIPPIKRVVYKVLSNHGNMKYTCIYRMHVYGST